MNPELKENQAELLAAAWKRAADERYWLNEGNLVYRPVEGETPFDNLMRAVREIDLPQSERRIISTDDMSELHEQLKSMLKNMDANLCRVENTADGTDYNWKEDLIYLADENAYDNLQDYAHDLYLTAYYATLHPDRFNRIALYVDGATEKELLKEHIVGELVVAEMLVENGFPARISPELLEWYDKSTKLITEEPAEFQDVIKSFNSSVEALHEIQSGRKPDYQKILDMTEKQQREVPEQSTASQEQVRHKSQSEQKAAERQVSLITAALLGSRDRDRVWMNPDSKLYPAFYPKGPAISPFNAINLTLHSDAHGYRTNLFTTFQESKLRGEGVKSSENGVPFNWYNWKQYVNINKPDDIISRTDYLALSREGKYNYKGIHNREIRTLFNLDQTMMPAIDPDNYSKAIDWSGGDRDRKPSPVSGFILRSAVDAFADNVARYLVPVEKFEALPSAHYDKTDDTVRVPSAASYPNYHDYVHDLVSEIVRATGHPERLAREGAVNPGSRDDHVREELVVELATGVKMLELGMPARLSPQSLELVDDWVRELREDPRMIDAVEADVNNALEVIRKAERGVKVVYSSYVNQEKVRQLQEMQKPQVSSAEYLVLSDIIRHHGMEIPDGSFKSDEEKNSFLEKFGLDYYNEQMQYAKGQTESDDPEVVEAAYADLYNYAAIVDEHAREYRPGEWNLKGRREVENFIDDLMEAEPREMVIIFDEKTRKADIILPQGALEGGKAVMPDGQERNFYITPDEVLTKEERKDAKVQYNDAPGFSKARIDHALANHPDFQPEFTRYFNREGIVGFHADDRYFEGKKLYTASLNRWALDNIRDHDIQDMVERSRLPQFDKVIMVKDEDSRWMLFMQPQGERPFAIYPDKADTNKYFTSFHQGNAAITAAVRQELATKYYELANVKPYLKVNVLGEKASEEDAARLQRVNIFKNKLGEYMIMAKVTDTPKDLAPRVITPTDWQRLWLSPDRDEYKRDLAARVFADVLHPEIASQQKQEEKSEQQEAEEESATYHMRR